MKNLSYIILSALLITQASTQAMISIHTAAYEGDNGLIPWFAQDQELLNSVDSIGFTPLHYAVFAGKKEVVVTLLENRAVIDVRDYVGRTPLHYAVQAGRTTVAELLIGSGAKMVAHDLLGWTPYDYAVYSGNREMISLLLDCSLKNGFDSEELIGKKNHTLYELMGMDSNSVLIHLPEWFFNAVKNNDLKQVTVLLAIDPTLVQRKDSSGNTPLHYAARQRSEALVDLLSRYSLSIIPHNQQGHTPYCYAFDNTAIKSILLDRWLHAMLSGQNLIDAWCQKRLSRGSKKITLPCFVFDDPQEKNNRSLLFNAVFNGWTEVIKVLLDHNDCLGKPNHINELNEKGYTLLHVAVEQGHTEAVQELLKHGALPIIKSYDGLTPLQIAQRKGFAHLTAALQCCC